MLRSRPTVMGMTTPGNSTVLRKGRMGSSGGVRSAFICSSSSAVMSGMSSVSFSIWSELKKAVSMEDVVHRQDGLPGWQSQNTSRCRV
jgi:hypothetical protein